MDIENFEPSRFNPMQNGLVTFNALFFYQLEIDMNQNNNLMDLSKEPSGIDDVGRWISENFSQNLDWNRLMSEVVKESDISPKVRHNWKLQHAMANYNRQMNLVGQGVIPEELLHSYFI